MKFYATKFKALREAADLTQMEVASALGIRYQSVQGWETGKTIPRMQNIYKLAKLLNCRASEFADLSPDEFIDTPISPYEFSKLTFYRKRANLSRKQLALALGVSEYDVECWEEFVCPFDQKFNIEIKRILNLSDSELDEIIANSVINPALERDENIRMHRIMRQDKPFYELNNFFVESFRQKAIGKIISLDIDPVAKNAVLQVINTL